MKKIVKGFLLASLLLSSVQIAVAQTSVSGHVTDEKNEPLPQVIIRRFATGHKLRGYTNSGSNGEFVIAAAEGDSLEFSMLGFESRKVVVSSVMKPLVIRLKPSGIDLKEVTVKSDKVREHGDTLTYVVGAYANGNDRTIDDVLSKMPGFDVDKASGRISYEGKPISKFYIEGLDMLGGKYGVATNTLPQQEVGAVEVMRNHQPIRVLEDFTFTDDAAVNIKMKDKAKSRWVVSDIIGGGYGDNHDGYDKALWRSEALGLRLKSGFQTMLTYKSNNSGMAVGREVDNLLALDESANQRPKEFIQLSKPMASGVENARSLLNRSHSATVNVLRRINENAQISMQIVYNNERDKAWGERLTEYSMIDGNRIINNVKSWRDNANDIFAQLKYEHNSLKSYVRNSLQTDIKWLSQCLYETGSRNHNQQSWLPAFELHDNVYAISRFGKTLLSFYSNNTAINMPQHLYVDSLRQYVSQRLYTTNTYAMGGLKHGQWSLSARLGMKGALRYISSEAYGLPDSLGLVADKSHVGYATLYVRPQLEYITKAVKVSASLPLEVSHYKYSGCSEKNFADVSPSLHMRWDATSRLAMSIRGSYDVEPIDINRFVGSLIMQDYLYLYRGLDGYDRAISQSVNYSLVYRNSLRGIHFMANITRAFDTNPYTMARYFVGDYIITGIAKEKTKDRRWIATAMLQQAFPWLEGKLSLRGMYNHSDSKMMQDGSMVPSRYNTLSSSASLYVSPYTDMSVSYSLQYTYNDMRPTTGSKTSFNSWRHNMKVIVPLGAIGLTLDGEYNHNQISPRAYKDTFFMDAACVYKTKHIDYEVRLNNLFNKRSYSQSTVGELMTVQSMSALRGREALFSIIYKP